MRVVENFRVLGWYVLVVVEYLVVKTRAKRNPVDHDG